MYLFVLLKLVSKVKKMKVILRTSDDSFVIQKYGMPYQVHPYIKEHAKLWDEINTYITNHPECVTEEYPHIPPEPTFEDVKALKLEEINTAADSAISKIVSTYPEKEIDSFGKQELEARAYLKNPESPTPFLSILAKTRGIALPDLVNKVILKADKFSILSARIIGQRQALEDKLKICTTIDEVKAITVDIITA